MTDPALRRRVAVHEAGHAVAFVVLGIPLEFASIRPGRSFLGVVVPAARDGADLGALNFDAICNEPPALREDVERRIIAGLAGELAELYGTATPASGYLDDDDEQIARAALATLPSRIAELVTEHEDRLDPVTADEDAARELADAFAGPDVGPHYLAWLRAEARDLVTRYAAAILRVADALERRAILTGDAVAALVHPQRSKGA
jgi:hypothetical protein